MSKPRSFRLAALAGLIVAALGGGMAGCEQVASLVTSEPHEYCQPSKAFPDKEVCVKVEYHDKAPVQVPEAK